MRLSRAPVAPGAPIVEFIDSGWSASLLSELAEGLEQKNGFFTFESALHVFSAQSVGNQPGLAEWNTAGLWKHAYEGRADRLLCFAEDIFGNQFAFDGSSIVLFAAETGETSAWARSIDEWAQRILRDYDVLTGYTFAHRWQARHGRLPIGDRLCPVTPFAVGGEYTVQNMRSGDRATLLRFLGSFASQIAGPPDGSKVRLTVE